MEQLMMLLISLNYTDEAAPVRYMDPKLKSCVARCAIAKWKQNGPPQPQIISIRVFSNMFWSSSMWRWSMESLGDLFAIVLDDMPERLGAPDPSRRRRSPRSPSCST
jgi:hypothetical protein